MTPEQIANAVALLSRGFSVQEIMEMEGLSERQVNNISGLVGRGFDQDEIVDLAFQGLEGQDNMRKMRKQLQTVPPSPEQDPIAALFREVVETSPRRREELAIRAENDPQIGPLLERIPPYGQRRGVAGQTRFPREAETADARVDSIFKFMLDDAIQSDEGIQELMSSLASSTNLDDTEAEENLLRLMTGFKYYRGDNVTEENLDSQIRGALRGNAEIAVLDQVNDAMGMLIQGSEDSDFPGATKPGTSYIFRRPRDEATRLRQRRDDKNRQRRLARNARRQEGIREQDAMMLDREKDANRRDVATGLAGNVGGFFYDLLTGGR